MTLYKHLSILIFQEPSEEKDKVENKTDSGSENKKSKSSKTKTSSATETVQKPQGIFTSLKEVKSRPIWSMMCIVLFNLTSLCYCQTKSKDHLKIGFGICSFVLVLTIFFEHKEVIC
jgi:hypothetical protein